MVGAVIYVRVRTKEQTENLSLPTPASCLREIPVGARAMRSWLTFTRKARAPSRQTVASFRTCSMYCRLNNCRFHFVVVFNLTRFARDKYDHFALRSHLPVPGHLAALGEGADLRHAPPQADGRRPGSLPRSSTKTSVRPGALPVIAGAASETRHQTRSSGSVRTVRPVLCRQTGRSRLPATAGRSRCECSLRRCRPRDATLRATSGPCNNPLVRVARASKNVNEILRAAHPQSSSNPRSAAIRSETGGYVRGTCAMCERWLTKDV